MLTRLRAFWKGFRDALRRAPGGVVITISDEQRAMLESSIGTAASLAAERLRSRIMAPWIGFGPTPGATRDELYRRARWVARTCRYEPTRAAAQAYVDSRDRASREAQVLLYQVFNLARLRRGRRERRS